jgi:hypothetical protein
MTSPKDPRSHDMDNKEKSRKLYREPAIIYEGKISIRAGTGETAPFQDGPTLPFDDPS